MKFLCFTSSTQNPNISNLKHAIKANKNEHQSKHLMKFKVGNECLKTQNENHKNGHKKGENEQKQTWLNGKRSRTTLPYKMTKSSIKTESFATFLAGDVADEDDEGFSRKENGQGCFWCSGWNVTMERYRYYKGKFGKIGTIEFQKYNRNFVFQSNWSLYTWLSCRHVYKTTSHAGRQLATLTEHLDGRTILIDIC